MARTHADATEGDAAHVPPSAQANAGQ